jgi:hypothetical protein
MNAPAIGRERTVIARWVNASVEIRINPVPKRSMGVEPRLEPDAQRVDL